MSLFYGSLCTLYCSDLSKRAFANERVNFILVIPSLSWLDDVVMILIIITFIQNKLLFLPTACRLHRLRSFSVLLLHIIDLQPQQQRDQIMTIKIKHTICIAQYAMLQKLKVEYGSTSHQTQYRSHQGWFIQVKRPNQQC